MPLGISPRMFSDRFNWERKVGGMVPSTKVPAWWKSGKENVSWASAFVSLCSLVQGDQMSQRHPSAFPEVTDYTLKLWTKTNPLFLRQCLSGMLWQRGKEPVTGSWSCALTELLFCSVVDFLSVASIMRAGTPWKVPHDRGLSWTLWSSVSDLPFLMS